MTGSSNPDVATEPEQKRAIALVLLFIIVVALFSRARGHEFVSFDDPIYVVENPHLEEGLSASGIAWAFTTFRGGNWSPLTWISHLLDYEFYGLENPGGHHMTSVLLHALTTVLLALALARLTREFWYSMAAALLFAIHPLRVESVVWVSERKDMMCGLFFAATLLAYARFVGRQGRSRSGAYGAVLLCFAACLMSKPMGVTLPFVLLLLDAWPLERARTVGWRRLVLEKVPLFALAIASSVVAVMAQHASGAVASLDRLPIGARLANAPIAYAGYVRNTVWPSGLACFYPHPGTIAGHGTALGEQVAGAMALLVVITGLVIASRKSMPALLTGWLWFLGMLVPVLGFIQVGSQSFADRYSHLPSIGLSIAFVWGTCAIVRRLKIGPSVFVPAGLAIALGLAAATYRQVDVWRSTRNLYEHALAVTDNNYVAHNNLGVLLEIAGDLDAAEAHFAAAIDARPNHVDALNNLGRMAQERGDVERAGDLYGRALEAAPSALVLNNLGALELDLGHKREALNYFERALAADPNLSEAVANVAGVYTAAGNTEAALPYLKRLVDISPRDSWAHLTLGFHAINRQEPIEAAQHFDRAVALDPTNAMPRVELAKLADRSGRTLEAIAHYESALELGNHSKSVWASLAYLHVRNGSVTRAVVCLKAALVGDDKNAAWANDLALLLATSEDVDVRNLSRALAWTRIATFRTDFERWDYLTTLAYVHAAHGNRTMALKWQREAIRLAPREQRPALIQRLQEYGTLIEMKR